MPDPKGPRPRWVLHMQAQCWRYLMGIGMLLHRMAPPRPPKPAFTRKIKSTVSGVTGTFDLLFYLPTDYDSERSSGFKHHKFPVLINFHGGGFTLGSPTDDARWIATVVDECDAVVVSVDYRRAPECPFPVAVEDGVDAVLWVSEHAEELGIDANKIALSGFSSGGNMAFTVPLRLYDHLTDFTNSESRNPSREDLSAPISMAKDDHSASSSSSTLPSGNDNRRAATNLAIPTNSRKTPNASVKSAPSVNLCAIVPFYPSTDYTRTREQRRNTCVRKDQELPALFTDLFDESYLHPPATVPLDSPYLSPGIATSAHLKAALPDEIVMFCCEWDMLLKEGQEFHERLIGDDIGKHVVYTLVEGVPHGWDKAPNPLKPTPGVKEHYLKACEELRRVFGAEATQAVGLDRRRRESRPVVR